MSWWSWAWALLALVGVTLEIAALVNRRRGDTLSEHVWKLQWPVRAVVVGFVGWLTWHFAFGP